MHADHRKKPDLLAKSLRAALDSVGSLKDTFDRLNPRPGEADRPTR